MIAQLTVSPGVARGIAIAVLSLTFLVRIIGNAIGGTNLFLWLTPMGWAGLIRPFAGEQWWIFSLFIAVTVVFGAVAFYLSAHRDLGAGLIATRPGPKEASPGFNSPFALAWRLQRGTLLAWIVGFAIMGTAFGLVAQTAQLPLLIVQ